MKWIVAYKTFLGWQMYVKCDDFGFAKHAFELCSQKRELVGIFRNGPGWENSKPRYLSDKRDKSGWPIRNAESIINSAQSTVL